MIDPKYRFLLHDEALTNRDKRITELEQLCRDMYDALIANHGGYVTVLTLELFGERMDALGLLEGEGK